MRLDEGRTRERMISIMALVLVISVCFLVPKAAAQSDKYPKMAPSRLWRMALAKSMRESKIGHPEAVLLIVG